MLLAAIGFFCRTANDRKPNPTEAARHNNLGVAYMNQQLFEKGLKEFQQAADADPKLAMARLNEGVAYLNMQKVDEAKKALEDALKQDPKSPNAWYSLGLLAKNTGDAPARSMLSSTSPRSTRTTPTPGIFSAQPMCRPSSFRRRSKPFSTR